MAIFTWSNPFRGVLSLGGDLNPSHLDYEPGVREDPNPFHRRMFGKTNPRCAQMWSRGAASRLGTWDLLSRHFMRKNSTEAMEQPKNTKEMGRMGKENHDVYAKFGFGCGWRPCSSIVESSIHTIAPAWRWMDPLLVGMNTDC